MEAVRSRRGGRGTPPRVGNAEGFEELGPGSRTEVSEVMKGGLVGAREPGWADQDTGTRQVGEYLKITFEDISTCIAECHGRLQVQS